MGAKPHPRLVRSICGGALGAALAMTPAVAGTTAAASRDAETTSPPRTVAEPLRPPPNPFGSPRAARHGDRTTGTGNVLSHRCRARSAAPARTTDHARTTPVRHLARGEGSGAAAGGEVSGTRRGSGTHAAERRSPFGPRLWSRHGAMAVRAVTEAEPEPGADQKPCPHRGPAARPGDRPDDRAGQRPEREAAGRSHPDAKTRAKQRPSTRQRNQPSLRRLSRAPVSASYGLPGGWLAGHHTGVDFAMSVGTPVHSVGNGTVTQAGWSGSYGNSVMVLLDDGHYALYAHLERIDVQQGARVAENTRIGLSGNTGRSTGPHLHFEIRTGQEYGSDIDPLNYLRERGAPRP